MTMTRPLTSHRPLTILLYVVHGEYGRKKLILRYGYKYLHLKTDENSKSAADNMISGAVVFF
jgi:hypothetical protein